MSLRGLALALGLGDDPERVLAPLRALYRRLDEELARRTSGLDLPCQAGCSDCCHESVFVSAPELLLVAERLLEEPLETRREVVGAMTAHARRYEDELELLELLEPGPERDEVAARVKLSCPLLDPEGRCRVYEARELNARTFGQSMDAERGVPYGCERTHARLRVLNEPPLADARAWRRALVAEVPGAAEVRVYPWWFARYGAHLL